MLNLSRIRLYFEQIRYADSNTERFAEEHWDFFQKMLGYLRQHDLDPKGKSVLDVGCGKNYWLTLLLHNYGSQATGMDVEYVHPGISPTKYLNILRHNGLERAAKTFYSDLLYGRAYFRALANQADFPLKHKGLDVRRLVLPDYPYEDDSFDLIVSHEVFEHIADMHEALGELRRVMRPGALTYLYVHLYPSISGGHHIAWKYPDENPSERVPPWDHLRENLYPQIPSWINRMREHEYRQAFEQAGLEILDWFSYATEGHTLLTQAILDELPDYSEEELLKKGIVIVARNPHD